MKFFRIAFLMMALVASSFATYNDFYLHLDGNAKNGLCLATAAFGRSSYDANGNRCADTTAIDVKIRVIDAQANPSQPLGFDVERPFLITDGIYLGTDGERTLSEFNDEINEVGLPNMLAGLGYTPILVQFTETVKRPLAENGWLFDYLLKFINSNKLFGFTNRSSDGFVILGISQGGIISRYGAYQYDLERAASDAPIRLYSSLDSPHQGAVIPKAVLHTIYFWGQFGGSSAAEQFKDLISNPGASELLINKTDAMPRYVEDFSTDRFIFGEYRKACEYKGFPSVLIAQGQLKGALLPHSDTLFILSRKVMKGGTTMGRAESKLFSTGSATDKLLAYNKIFERMQNKPSETVTKSSIYDFIQGSTHSFSELLYGKLKDGFIESIPDEKTYFMNILSVKAVTKMYGSWDNDSLYQAKSTFIPTTSAMDLKCRGDLSLGQYCAFSQNSDGISFEHPGERSSANAAYAVDPTHPRYSEKMSGKHIELPWKGNTLDTLVLRGMQTDIWRVLCELSKVDYDSALGDFRNEHLSEYFVPGESCMDLANIPTIINRSGFYLQKKFSYARYDYNTNATERNDSVDFNVSAGWHRVAWFDNGAVIPEGSAFEVDIQVDNAKNDWMKAELLLHMHKTENNQLQLTEVTVPTDGKKHTLHWDMPFSNASMSKYRWFRLVLNSDGANVTLSNPRIIKTGIDAMEPDPIVSNVIFPIFNYAVVPWSSSTVINKTSSQLNISFAKHGAGLHIKFGSQRSLSAYDSLIVTYTPGTCQSTSVYFDSYKSAATSLASNDQFVDNNTVFGYKKIPLEEIIDRNVTPNFSLSASFLSMVAHQAGETCNINGIYLK